MSLGEKTFAVIKSVFLYQDTMRAVREDVAALATDVTALARAHATLSERVARLEGIIEGAAMATGAVSPRIGKK